MVLIEKAHHVSPPRHHSAPNFTNGASAQFRKGTICYFIPPLRPPNFRRLVHKVTTPILIPTIGPRNLQPHLAEDGQLLESIVPGNKGNGVDVNKINRVNHPGKPNRKKSDGMRFTPTSWSGSGSNGTTAIQPQRSAARYQTPLFNSPFLRPPKVGRNDVH